MNCVQNTEEGIDRIPSKSKCREVFLSADAVCFDVDSTVSTDEAIDQLAHYCGKAEQVKKLTEEAMKGGLDFREALRRRLNIIRPSLDTIRRFLKDSPPTITEGVDLFIEKLFERSVDVYLVSGGFRSLIAPLAKQLSIPLENIFANRLKFFYDGEYGGFDESQPTSRTGGKGDVVRYLKEKNGYNNVVMIGDGATDLEACPPADAFVGFGGNVVRESVRSRSQWYVYDFATLTEELEKD